MTQVIVRHKVNDFPAWKAVFDDFAATRRAGGEKAFRIWQDDNDPHDLILLFDWDDRKNAEKFFASSELKSTMQRAGVANQPTIEYVKEVAKGTL
jgi:quinol monooxygenase YgiN